MMKLFILMVNFSFLQLLQGGKYEIRVQSVDDLGKAVEGIKVIATRLEKVDESGASQGRLVTTDPIVTDDKGFGIIQFIAPSDPMGDVSFYQEGYYTTRGKVVWSDAGRPADENYFADIKAVMKPVRNPVPMVFHPRIAFSIKEIGVEYRLDLELGEFLPPYGRGIHPDLLIVMTGKRFADGISKDAEIDFLASIRFSNPLDGFVEFDVSPGDKDKGSFISSLLSDYRAPEREYQAVIERRGMWGEIRKTPAYWEYEKSIEYKACYFRVRTKADVSGEIISSNYGKIYGPIKLFPGPTEGYYPNSIDGRLYISNIYFNPFSNDRNVECYTKVKLSKLMNEYHQPIGIDRP